jgi:hypothetical protein
VSLPAVDLVNKWLAMRLDSSFSLALQHWSRLLINPNSGKTRPPRRIAKHGWERFHCASSYPFARLAVCLFMQAA